MQEKVRLNTTVKNLMIAIILETEIMSQNKMKPIEMILESLVEAMSLIMVKCKQVSNFSKEMQP